MPEESKSPKLQLPQSVKEMADELSVDQCWANLTFPNDIFKEAGFDLKIIGKKTPNNRIRAWKFYERHSNKNNTKYLAKEIKKNKALKNILEENRYLKAENEFLKSGLRAECETVKAMSLTV